MASQSSVLAWMSLAEALLQVLLGVLGRANGSRIQNHRMLWVGRDL